MKKLIKELKLGDNYDELFSYTQNEVDIFAKISGEASFSPLLTASKALKKDSM